MIKSAQLTAEWEEHLKQIEHGTLSPQTFLEGVSLMTKDLVSTYKIIEGVNTLFPTNRKGKPIGKCPRCGSEVIENKKGFCCDDRACHFALWKENEFFTIKKKALTKPIAIDLLKKGKVSLAGCYSEKTGKTYEAILILDDMATTDELGYNIQAFSRIIGVKEDAVIEYAPSLVYVILKVVLSKVS